MHRGYVQLWRKEKESRVFKNERLWKVYTWCLMKASHQKRWISVTTGKGKTEVLLRPGQFLFGRESAAEELDMPASTVWYQMRKLRSMDRITIKSDSHYSIVTVRNLEQNQIQHNEIEQPMDSQPTASQQPTDTKKNVKNVQKEITQQADAIYAAYPKKADKKNTIKSIINLLKAGNTPEELLRSIENYQAEIERKGTQRDYIIQSNNFFGRDARWEEFKEAKDQQGFDTGKGSRYNWLECCKCGMAASNVKVNKEDNLAYCACCSD